MDNSTKIMRLEIDGKWTAEDMIKSFSCLQDLYNLRFMLQVEYEEWKEWRDFYEELRFSPVFHKRFRDRLFFARDFFPLFDKSVLPLTDTELSKSPRLFYPEERLYVRRVNYGSKGIKDLAGVGEIIGHVKDFVLDVIHLCVDRESACPG